MSFMKKAVKNGPKIAHDGGLLLGGATIGGMTVGVCLWLAFRKWIKKHDRVTAEKMRAEFNERLNSIRVEYEGREEELKAKIIALCKEFGYDPSNYF